MTTRYGMLNRITTKPAQRDAVVEILLSGARMQGAMNGCELYVVHTSPKDPNQIWVTEVWRSKENHEASLMNAQVRALIEKGRPLIVSIEQNITVPVGGKGLAGGYWLWGTVTVPPAVALFPDPSVATAPIV